MFSSQLYSVKRRQAVSVKIRISYERPEELHRVIKALLPLGITWKPAEQKGQYKRAYVVIKE